MGSRFLFYTLSFFLFFMPVSCGVKRFPRPSKFKQLPVATNLKAVVSDNVVRVSWTIPPFESLHESISGCRIYEASAKEKNCLKCPVRFRLIRDIPVSYGFPGKRDMEYEIPVKKGLSYQYKIRIYTDKGNVGEYSNPVKVDLLK